MLRLSLMRCFLADPSVCAVDRALSESAHLLDVVRAEASPLDEPRVALGAWELEPGSQIVLGALQHAGRVLRSVERDVVRRSTSGAAAQVDGGLLLSMALSSIDAIFPDATTRTVLNRNVRPWLGALAEAGLGCTYLGRDVLSLRRDPLFLLGLDVAPDGALLLEAIASARSSIALPQDRATDLERALDRHRGRRPVALDEVTGGRAPLELGRRVLRSLVERLAPASLHMAGSPPSPHADRRVISLHDPAPPDATFVPPKAVPIGWLDLAKTSHGGWIGGDVLAPVHALGAVLPDRRPTGNEPIDGARWSDVADALEALRASS